VTVLEEQLEDFAYNVARIADSLEQIEERLAELRRIAERGAKGLDDGE
jgi:chaperonin cofactor prefoldin